MTERRQMADPGEVRTTPPNPHPPMALPDDVLASLPSPCLVVDLEAATRNISYLADFAAQHGIALRPHFKAHKCTRLMRRQLDAGGCSGVTCQTSAEALVLAEAGFQDILVTNEVVDPIGLADLARAARIAHVSTCADSIAGVQALDATALQYSVHLGVLVEVEVGLGRCGLKADGPELLEVAALIGRSTSLSFRGLQGYEGHAMFIDDKSARHGMVTEAAARLTLARRRLETIGVVCDVVSGGGTGTFDLAPDLRVWTELQAGSYVLLDASYARLSLPFELALYCLASLVSRRGSTVVLDAGLKTLAVDKGMPMASDSRLRIMRLSDEHAIGELSGGLDLDVGDRVWLIPSHLDPTMNLADAVFAWSPDAGLETLVIDGRRSLRSMYPR